MYKRNQHGRASFLFGTNTVLLYPFWIHFFTYSLVEQKKPAEPPLKLKRKQESEKECRVSSEVVTYTTTFPRVSDQKNLHRPIHKTRNVYDYHKATIISKHNSKIGIWVEYSWREPTYRLPGCLKLPRL